MIDLLPYRNRLLEQVTGLKAVGGWAEYEEELRQLSMSPQSFILPAPVKYGANQLINAVQQQGTEHITIITVFNASGNRHEVSYLQDFATLIQATHAALLGWSPDGAKLAPLTLVDGDPVGVNGGALWWQDIFETSYYERSI